jgi:hypothetical protein
MAPPLSSAKVPTVLIRGDTGSVPRYPVARPSRVCSGSAGWNGSESLGYQEAYPRWCAGTKVGAAPAEGAAAMTAPHAQRPATVSLTRLRHFWQRVTTPDRNVISGRPQGDTLLWRPQHCLAAQSVRRVTADLR